MQAPRFRFAHDAGKRSRRKGETLTTAVRGREIVEATLAANIGFCAVLGGAWLIRAAPITAVAVGVIFLACSATRAILRAKEAAMRRKVSRFQASFASQSRTVKFHWMSRRARHCRSGTGAYPVPFRVGLCAALQGCSAAHSARAGRNKTIAAGHSQAPKRRSRGQLRSAAPAEQTAGTTTPP